MPGGFRVQSIDVGSVARALLEAAVAPPAGRLRDLAGPEAMSVARAARLWVRARSEWRAIVPLPMPGAAARALRAGQNTVPDRPSGSETWEDWLERTYGGER